MLVFIYCFRGTPNEVVSQRENFSRIAIAGFFPAIAIPIATTNSITALYMDYLYTIRELKVAITGDDC